MAMQLVVQGRAPANGVIEGLTEELTARLLLHNPYLFDPINSMAQSAEALGYLRNQGSGILGTVPDSSWYGCVNGNMSSISLYAEIRIHQHAINAGKGAAAVAMEICWCRDMGKGGRE